ncbi:hypothetical protein, partial [uncultured Alistipes sp.]|uniref:hypothetical protein n=1 Tax=uncultured Alistipes sp. TaxID=538949 RepID=UPI00260EB827
CFRNERTNINKDSRIYDFRIRFSSTPGDNLSLRGALRGEKQNLGAPEGDDPQLREGKSRQ